MTDTTGRTRLLERAAELELIGRSLDDAVSGRGGTVLLKGAAGIGTSSLLDAAAELADARGMTLLRARGAAMEREFALGLVLQLLVPHIEPLTGRDRDRVFAGAAGLARPLFEEVPGRASAEGRLFARFHGLHWLCARLGEERSLAVLVDDAHWADGHSLRFLAYLAARIEEIPACAIVAVRTGEDPAEPAALAELCEHGRGTVRPAALSPGAVAELVRDRLGEGTADEVCAECADDGREPASRASSDHRDRAAGCRPGEPRRRRDRRHGTASDRAARERAPAAAPAGGGRGGAGARDPRRGRLAGRRRPRSRRSAGRRRSTRWTG